MLDDKVKTQDKSINRREFMRSIKKYGVSAAVVMASGGLIGVAPKHVLAQTAADERKKKAKAKYTMITAVDGILNRYDSESLTQGETIYIYGANRYKKEIEERSNGDIYVDIKTGGSIGFQAFSKVQQGVIQACNASTQNVASAIPIWNVLDFPFSIGKVENMRNIFYSKEITKTLRKASEERGLMLLSGDPFMRWLHFGQSVKHKVIMPGDVKGLKLRATNSKLELASLEILGANPTPVGAGDIVTAMNQGMVDGYNIAPHFTVDFNLTNAVKTALDTNFMPNTDCYWVSTKWFQALPDNLQEAILETSFIVQQEAINSGSNINTIQVGTDADSPEDSPFKQAKIDVHYLTEDQRNEWMDYMSIEKNPILQELAQRYGSKEVELVREIANGEKLEPQKWWET